MESLQAAELALCAAAAAQHSSNTSTAATAPAAAAAPAAAITSASELMTRVSSLLAQALAPVSVRYWMLAPAESALQEGTCYSGGASHLSGM